MASKIDDNDRPGSESLTYQIVWLEAVRKAQEVEREMSIARIKAMFSK